MKKTKISIAAVLFTVTSVTQAATVVIGNKTDRAIRAYVVGSNHSNRKSSVRIYPGDYKTFKGDNITGPARFVILESKDVPSYHRTYHRLFADRVYETTRNTAQCSGKELKWLEISFDEKTEKATVETIAGWTDKTGIIEGGEKFTEYIEGRKLEDSDAEVFDPEIPDKYERWLNRHYQDRVNW